MTTPRRLRRPEPKRYLDHWWITRWMSARVATFVPPPEWQQAHAPNCSAWKLDHVGDCCGGNQ